MRVFRWGLAFALVSLHVVMKAPVWSLIARVNVVGGSSGYHRYELVNQTILHFRDWWLLGAKDTEQWGYLMHDTANAFVDAAVTGGLLGLVLFIVILVRTFRCVGLARKAANGERQRQLRYWAWGSWLLATVVSFFGITYFDQSQVVWYSLLALVSVATISPGSGCCQTQYSLRAFSDAREPSDAAV
jgi:O-antigen ligase